MANIDKSKKEKKSYFVFTKEISTGSKNDMFSVNKEVTTDELRSYRIKYRLSIVNIGEDNFNGDILILDNLDPIFAFGNILKFSELTFEKSNDSFKYQENSRLNEIISVTSIRNVIKCFIEEISIKPRKGLSIEFDIYLR